jgi:hypothetical protein
VPPGDERYALEEPSTGDACRLWAYPLYGEVLATVVHRRTNMNFTRVLLGGLVAGLVMLLSQIVLHTIVLADQGKKLVADWATRGLDASASLEPSLPLTGAIFLLGLISVWVYAAIRPRFGPGARTAIVAGIVVWAASHLFTGVYVHAGVVIVPSRMVWLPVAWTFIEVQIATLVGAWLYRE